MTRRDRPVPIHRRLGMRPRCIRCRMRSDLCICAAMEPVQVALRFVVVMHMKEANKPTNTGFLVRAVLPSTEIRIRGRGDERIDLSDLSEAAVLFPMEDAEEIDPDDLPGVLIVPDGTWRQARDIVRRELMKHRHVKLPAGAPGEFRIRTAVDAHQLSTFEAIARVVGMTEGEEAEERMMRVFRMMVDRVLWMRGELETERVFGGIPDEVARMRGK